MTLWKYRVDVAAMGEIHELIASKGIEQVRREAPSRHGRAVVETAYQVLGEEVEKIGFAYSGFALTCLPHKPLDATVWKREGHNITMLLRSGLDRHERPIGLPYGSYARFILLFLQSQAVKSRCREIELGRSMRIWLGRMGLSIGGNTYRKVNEQARRISACDLTFFVDKGPREISRKAGFVDGGISMTDVMNDGQASLWQETVLLNEHFYRALLEHPVPVSEAGLRAIGPRSMVLDVYIWLAYRLHALRRDAVVGWTALHAQFGVGYGRLDNFRRHFVECLELATAAYPEAKVGVSATGVTLHPSRPAIRQG